MKSKYLCSFVVLIPLTFSSHVHVIPPEVKSPVFEVGSSSTGQIDASDGVLTASSGIKEYIDAQAILFGVNPKLADCIVTHESQWNPTKLGSEKIDVSQGLWQIYSKAWPDITRAETFDPVWSTNWALTQIKNGHVKYWSTYKEYCENIPVYEK